MKATCCAQEARRVRARNRSKIAWRSCQIVTIVICTEITGTVCIGYNCEQGATHMSTTVLITFILTALVAGILGGAVMEGVLWLIGRSGWAKADMIVAL